jgi:hypothetical protein
MTWTACTRSAQPTLHAGQHGIGWQPSPPTARCLPSRPGSALAVTFGWGDCTAAAKALAKCIVAPFYLID